MCHLLDLLPYYHLLLAYKHQHAVLSNSASRKDIMQRWAESSKQLSVYTSQPQTNIWQPFQELMQGNTKHNMLYVVSPPCFMVRGTLDTTCLAILVMVSDRKHISACAL